MKKQAKARLCIACGLPAATWRGSTVSGLACHICARLRPFKWESAVDEWKRILRAERDEQKGC